MSNNWIVENIQNALDTWNDKLNEIWRAAFAVAYRVQGRHGMECYGKHQRNAQSGWLCALVLFFLMGIMKHYNSMQEIKRPGTGTQAVYPFLCLRKRRSHGGWI